ncbi:MAG: hypothetical protein ILA25_08510 [Prevotella sp.]|nr:hypothetical protein [Prevotella sp.]
MHNPRYEEQRSQNEALNTIAEEQKEKLLVLLRDIIARGLNLSDIPIVMPDKEKVNGYIVLEGNRRIAALKLFKKPSILTSNSLRQKYAKLHEKHKDFALKSIECLVVDTREEANIWIERKHEGEMNGAGTVKWNSEQSARFRASKTGKDTRAVQLIDFMKAATEGDAEFTEQLRKVKATNLERLISTPEVCSDLGLLYNHGEFTSKYECEEVLKGLKAIVKRLSQDDFNVSQIYHKDDRLSFMGSIPPEELPDTSRRATDTWLLKDYSSQRGVQGKSGVKEDDTATGAVDDNTAGTDNDQRPTRRWHFVPDGLKLAIPNERSNRILSELKQLSHVAMPNACAVMMRVFLELSVDCYLEEFHLLKNGAVSASKDPRDLKQKTNEVINQMIQQKIYLDQAKAKGIRTEINNDKSVFSIDTLNAYVHNLTFNPIPETLMLSWDNIEPFIVAVWKAINDNRK